MRLAAVVMAASVLAAAPAHADRIVLTFDGSAYGIIPLGRASLDFSVDPDAYRVGGQIQSGGLAALFDRTDLRAISTGGADAIVWRTYDLDHSYAKKRRIVAMKATPDGVNADITPPFRVSINPPSDADKRGARDPLSSIVAMAATVARTGDCTGVYPTFDGRFRYDLTLRVEGRTRHSGGGYDGPVLKCKLRYTPVSGYDTPKQMSKRIPEGEIWFALDGDVALAAPVRVSAPLPLGHATIKLSSYKRARVDVATETVATSPQPLRP